METEKYRALLSAIDTGSLTGAAEALGYTPSGISRMIAVLEEEAGFRLLARDRNGVTPTPECHRLLPEIRNVVLAEDSYMQMADEIKGLHTGTITIGTSIDAFFFFPFLTRLIAQFSKDYPNIRVNLVEGLSSYLAKSVEERQVDFCIVSKREGDFRWIPIAEDPLVALVPQDSKYAKQKTFPIENFRTEPFIDIYHSDETDNFLMFKRYGITPKITFSCTNSFAAASMIEAGLGISTENQMIASSLDSRIKLLPLDPPQIIEIGIAAPHEKNASPAAKRFLALAEEKLASEPFPSKLY